MTWIKLDDKSPRHPKIASLTDRAFRWWINGLCYASEFLTNGKLPPVFWKQTPKQVRSELSDGQLWDWHEPNFEIHDYLGHQSSKESVEKKKADSADRVARYRERKRNGVTSNAESVTGNAEVTVPDTENREQRTDTENRDLKGAVAPSRPRPIISGSSSPLGWAKAHSGHIPDFCDFVCLPELVFQEFVARVVNAGADEGDARKQVKDWARSVRQAWSGRIPGDNIFEFWRNEWKATHGSNKPASSGGVDVLAGLR